MDDAKINRLDQAIIDILEEVGQKTILQSWYQRTRCMESNQKTIKSINDMADVCALSSGADVVKEFPWVKIEWEWRRLFNGFVKLPFPRVMSPRLTAMRVTAKFQKAAGLMKMISAELAKELECVQDVFSIVKTEKGKHRFYSGDGDLLTDIYSDEWPNDRIMAGAETVPVRYAQTLEEARQWKLDMEVWLLRKYIQCPEVVRQRIGAYKI